MNDQSEKMYFTNTHEWIKSTEEGMVMGITDHAQTLLGDLVYVDLPDIGKTVQLGDEIAVVESVKAASDVYSPISGTVIAVNEALRENPAMVNQSPFDDGWLIKLKASNPSEMHTLLDQEAYAHVIEQEH